MLIRQSNIIGKDIKWVFELDSNQKPEYSDLNLLF